MLVSTCLGLPSGRNQPNDQNYARDRNTSSQPSSDNVKGLKPVALGAGIYIYYFILGWKIINKPCLAGAAVVLGKLGLFGALHPAVAVGK